MIPVAGQRWTLTHADCRDWLATLEEASVDAVVCDPPYEIGFMGQRWDGTGVAFDPATWAAVLRVMKPGAHLVAFGGARTYHRLACAIEDARFDIRDQLMWIFGSGFPKGGVRNGVGTGLKPAHEPIALARVPFRGSARDNIDRYGTGGLNIDACRVAGQARPFGKGTARHGGQLGGGGNSSGDRGHWIGKALGRWPANVIHDGSDEVLAGFPDVGLSSGGVGEASRLTKDGAIYGRLTKPRMGPSAGGFGDTGSAARFFYCAKASKADRDEGCEGIERRPANARNTFANLPDLRTEHHQQRLPRGNHHPTVKPTRLMRWLVRLVTPVGGLVIDPFAGSGSTGKAALLEGRRFAGCELTPDYLPIARARIAHAAAAAESKAA